MAVNWSRAKCSGANTEQFFQADHNRYLRDYLVRRYCADCPIRIDCLRENLTVPDGLYGGLSSKQRYRLLRRYGRNFILLTSGNMQRYDRGRAIERHKTTGH